MVAMVEEGGTSDATVLIADANCNFPVTVASVAGLRRSPRLRRPERRHRRQRARILRMTELVSDSGTTHVKALTWHGKSDIRCTSVPDPKLEHARDAIIKVTACAICGSDLHI